MAFEANSLATKIEKQRAALLEKLDHHRKQETEESVSAILIPGRLGVVDGRLSVVEELLVEFSTHTVPGARHSTLLLMAPSFVEAYASAGVAMEDGADTGKSTPTSRGGMPSTSSGDAVAVTGALHERGADLQASSAVRNSLGEKLLLK